MKWFVCDDCGKLFSEGEAASRPAELEDGTEPWCKILLCPVCKSAHLAEAEICPLCGKPHIPTETTYCDGCVNYTEATLKSIAWIRGEGDNSEEALKDLICKIYKW